MQTKGVDISEHNGAVDFAALTQAGVKFAILRLGYGSDYTSQDDAQFAQNVRKAEAAGHGNLSDTPLEYTGPPCKVKRERMRKGSHQAAGAARRHRARRIEGVPVSTKLNELSNDNRRPVAA